MSSAPGFRRFSLGLLTVLALASCGPEPTPLPVVPVAATLAPEAAQPADALPVVMLDALTLRLLPDDARVRLDAVATLQIVEAVDTNGPALSLLPFDGATPTRYLLNVATQINADLAPLNEPALRAAVTAFLNDKAADPLREALANAGYPDGLTLTVAVEPSLAPLLLAGLSGPIHWVGVPAGPQAQVSLMAGSEADALIDAGGLLIGGLPLYAQGWQVERSDDGLPIFIVPPAG
jgi:hypothetical protein